MLELRPLVVQELELRGIGINQRLLLRQIQTRRESEIMPRADENQGVALQLQTVAHHGDFSFQFPQREIVRYQLRGQHQTRVLEVRFRLLRGGARPLDSAAHPAEQVGFVVHVRTQHEIVLHRGLVRHGILAERAVGRGLAAFRRCGHSNPRVQIRVGNGDLIACLIEPRRGDAQVLVAGERALDQRIQSRVLKQRPPFTLERGVVRRRLMPRRIGLPGRGHLGRGTLVIRAYRAAGGERTGGECSKLEAAGHC